MESITLQFFSLTYMYMTYSDENKTCYPEKMGICKVITKENALLHHATFIKLTGYTMIACPNNTNIIAKPLRISISL